VSTHRTAHRLTLVLTGLTTAVVLTACGGGDSSTDGSTAAGGSASSSASVTTHDDDDVAFAQLMTAHHEQAVEMAQLAADRAGSAEVRDLAARIEAAQGPEIETMTGWLDEWGASAPTSGMPMSGMDHGGHDSAGMPGGMSAAELDRLTSLSGSEFDREFLTMMISHHQGALDMARTEQAAGSDPDAVALAGRIAADQTAQIGEMQALIGRL